MYMNKEPQLDKRYVSKALKDELTLESLFHKHIVIVHAILKKLYKDYLVLIDFQYVAHPNKNQISSRGTHCFFDVAQDKSW